MIQNFTVCQIHNKDKKRWDNLLLCSQYPSYRQSIEYNKTKEFVHKTSTTFIFQTNNIDVAGVHYSLKKSFGGLFIIADIVSGIVFREKPDTTTLRFILNHFIQWASEQKVTFIRITPWLPLNIKGKTMDFATELDSVYAEFGFSRLSEGRHTYWIDLSLEEDELRKRMNAQTRKKIRLAEDANISVELIETFESEKVKIFFELYNRLGNRKQFETMSEERFLSENKSLFDAGASLFFLKYHDIVIDIALVSSYGIASYYHGALNPDYKQLDGCPSPGHFMQWTMIKHMRKKGLTVYDMAFCPGPVPIKDHPRFDMWRFKYGFGGDHVEYMPIYGKVLQPLRGRIFKFLLYRK